jgi:phosphate transport system permease protein
VNTITQRVVSLGGAAAIGAIALIFVYLLWVVAPIMAGASVEEGSRLALSREQSLFLESNESGEIGLRFSAQGKALFFTLDDGTSISESTLAQSLHRVKRVYPQSTMYAVLDGNRNLGIFEATYPVSFDGDQRSVQPTLTHIFGAEWLALTDRTDLGELRDFDVAYQDFDMVVATLHQNTLSISHFRDSEPGYPLEYPRQGNIRLERDYERVLFGPRATWVYLLASDGTVEIFDLKRKTSPKQIYLGKLVPDGRLITALEPLLGRYSLLVADDANTIAQWFLIRDEFGHTLERVRDFELESPAAKIIPEQRRKGFGVVDARGEFYLLYTTSEQTLTQHDLVNKDIDAISFAPRSNLLLTSGVDGQVTTYRIDNEHPEISWKSLWSKVWYEGYKEPVYSWQSSSADNDFEAKFSLTPLLFGTLKAAFYAMLFAVPIAIMGAIYTAYFMAPSMRRIVKPGIEIMAALPTVILGFLAGLWLAPLIEAQLASVITTFLTLPIAIFLMALLWAKLPDGMTRRFEGWYGMLILPVIALAVWTAFWLGPITETTFFGGNSRAWFLEVMGLDYDQRNALVVGLAMGLAVIPTIFSIAEDAIYGVPTHLTNGSLALGATPWQTLARVVILTASPGIFSAIMIGLGRAVGETMIVLMATGNTPIMDLNIFEGMRTFAANIAVELPESEVNSTHYRILFLAALVLFIITFIFNTAAEIVRQRLRVRYGNL